MRHALNAIALSGWAMIALLLAAHRTEAQPARFDIHGPPGSVAFGAQVAVLSNGNIVVTDPRRPPDGAAYLYTPTGVLLSTVTNISPQAHRSVPLDRVRIITLANGNYLLVNTVWDHAAIKRAGMVAWASGSTGLSGSISSENALVGNGIDEWVGFGGVFPLANGNYVVSTWNWVNGGRRFAAATWGSGTSGVSGLITEENSVVGENMTVGLVLENGNFVLIDLTWGGVGAAMWVDGETGATGRLSAEKSLIGSRPADFFFRRLYELANGNYVVVLPYWDNGNQADAGAVAWGAGNRPTVGKISAKNALVGARAGTYVGYDEVEPLANGNYVVVSPGWDSDTETNVGAVTLGDGANGTTGEITSTNSLVGSISFEYIGTDPEWEIDGIVALANGHYVVTSPRWGAERGAVTWCDGTDGCIGTVSMSNSLTGKTPKDAVGALSVVSLTNGNYVVSSQLGHDDEGLITGMATHVDGSTTRSGELSPDDSLIAVGTVAPSLVPLTNGNYLVSFPGWDRGTTFDAGALAWGDGDRGIVGEVSALNSLVGSRENDRVGMPIALSNGHYVVCSQFYSSASSRHVGAVTWGSGWGGLVGEIGPHNSMIGSTTDDRLCSEQDDYRKLILPRGQFLIVSPKYDDQGIVDAGAFTLADGFIAGTVNSRNSVVGSVAYAGEEGGRPGMFAVYDFTHDRLVVGRSASNQVTLTSAARTFRKTRVLDTAGAARGLGSERSASSPTFRDTDLSETHD